MLLNRGYQNIIQNCICLILMSLSLYFVEELPRLSNELRLKRLSFRFGIWPSLGTVTSYKRNTFALSDKDAL